MVIFLASTLILSSGAGYEKKREFRADSKVATTIITNSQSTLSAEDTTAVIIDFINEVNPDITKREATLYAGWIKKYSTKHGVSFATLSGIIATESRFVSNSASSEGASGLSGIMPGSAKMFLDSLGYDKNINLRLNPKASIELSAYILKRLKALYGSEEAALAYYNGGWKAKDAYVYTNKYKNTDHWKLTTMWIKKEMSMLKARNDKSLKPRLKILSELLIAKSGLPNQTKKYIPKVLSYKRMLLDRV